tara:strand:+ start:368 stop:478 length:111 start_codon:yes stop_codon:yes gene_type:complete
MVIVVTLVMVVKVAVVAVHPHIRGTVLQKAMVIRTV